MSEKIKVVLYFTAAEGIFGEACSNSLPKTKLSEVVWRDGDPWEKDMEKLVFCLVILKDGSVVIGKNSEGSRSEAYEDAARQL